MTRNQIIDAYIKRRNVLDVKIRGLKLRGRGFVTGEIVSFLAFLAFIVAYTTLDWGVVTLLMAAVALILYFIIRRLDISNSNHVERLKSLRTVADNEVSYYQGDYSRFDAGKRYICSNHPYTYDMDVFGCDSLYNRIDRTVTTGGADVLAAWLSSKHFYEGHISVERIRLRREAVDMLAAMPKWRECFIAMGSTGKIDSHKMLAVLNSVKTMHISQTLSSHLSLFVALSCLLLFAILIILSVFADLPSTVPSLWGVFQFFIVLMICSSPLRIVARAAGKIHVQMSKYVLLLHHVYRLQDEIKDCGQDITKHPYSEAVAAIARELSGSLESFNEIEQILKAVDRRANVLGLILFDTFMLSDFFLVRKFLRWRRTWLSHIESWIDAVSRLDALVSMATFRYNEPEAVAAEIVDTDNVVFEAAELSHPFLGAKAVSNDFQVDERNYYIVTGANMAGKSTFLRSLGVNYILAMNGMPVFAKRLRLSVFSLFTSMRTTDDLTRGISYFNAELLRLKYLIDECSCQRNTLIILDEILKGTNSVDKLNGSRLFLEYISSRRVCGVIATHDLELSRMAEVYPDTFHNYCFEIELGDSVTYSYKIAPGVARNQNATFLLKGLLAEAATRSDR